MAVKNYSYMPIMGEEGTFVKPMPSPPHIEEGEVWFKNLSPHHRLYYHQTLNSVRKNVNFKQSPFIPKDDFDLTLLSRYDHSLEVFPDRVDSIMQSETAGMKTFRKLKNTKDTVTATSENMGHPLKIGGIKEKISPHSVKLMNSGHHTQLTNPGYSRQPGDGNIFKY